jgi:hypothetical protein
MSASADPMMTVDEAVEFLEYRWLDRDPRYDRSTAHHAVRALIEHYRTDHERELTT